VFWRQRQEDPEFETSLAYAVGPCLTEEEKYCPTTSVSFMCHKTNFNILKSVEIPLRMFSDDNEIELEINNRKTTEKNRQTNRKFKQYTSKCYEFKRKSQGKHESILN
jgi:hypothetical protein